MFVAEEGKPKKTRRLVQYSNGKVVEQFGYQKVIEPKTLVEEPEPPYLRVKDLTAMIHHQDYKDEEY